VLDARTGKWLESGIGPGKGVSTAALAPDETLAAVGTLDGKTRLLKLPRGETLADLPDHQDAVEALAFDDRAGLLATGSRDRSVRLWQREGSGFRPVLTLRGLPGTVSALWLQADGERLGVLLQNEAAVRVWDLKRLRRDCEDMGIGW
jgi:WD40 repeat protein